MGERLGESFLGPLFEVTTRLIQPEGDLRGAQGDVDRPRARLLIEPFEFSEEFLKPALEVRAMASRENQT